MDLHETLDTLGKRIKVSVFLNLKADEQRTLLSNGRSAINALGLLRWNEDKELWN